MANDRYQVPDYGMSLFQQNMATGRDEIQSILQRLLAEMSIRQRETESVRGAETQRLGMAANIAGPLDPAGTLSKLAPSIPSVGLEELIPGVKKRFDLNQQQKMFKQGAQGIGVKQGSNKFDQSVAGGGVEAGAKKLMEAVNRQVVEMTGGQPPLRIGPRISTREFDAAVELAQGPLKQQAEELRYGNYGSTFFSMRAKEEEMTELTNAKHQLRRDWLGAQWDVRKTKPYNDKLLKLNTTLKFHGLANTNVQKLQKLLAEKKEAEAGKGDFGVLMAGSKDPVGSPGNKAYLLRLEKLDKEFEPRIIAAQEAAQSEYEDARKLIGMKIDAKERERFQPQQQGPSVGGFLGGGR